LGDGIVVTFVWQTAVSTCRTTFSGSMVGGSLIHELNNLDAGVDDIDAVLFSHRHADHMGWLATDTASGPKLTFGSAEHVLHRISPITCSVAWCPLAALATSPVSIQIQLI